jgi:sulfhydrogenase subunit alpha
MKKKARRRIALKVPFVTRLEGEGSLELNARGDRIDRLHLAIFEPPRLFEKFLEGRGYQEVPDLNARICGICPMAYQLTSIQAMERLFGIALPPPLAQLRLLMNLGEWVQSHACIFTFWRHPTFSGLIMLSTWPRCSPGC